MGDGSASVYLLLYGTGIRSRSDLSMVTVAIGGESIPVTAAMAQGEYDGLDQINVGPLPASLAGRGVVALELKVDGVSANQVIVDIQ